MDRQDQSVKIVSRDPKRYCVNAYFDFLDCPLLSLEEKVIFLCLKKFLDFNRDAAGEKGMIDPSLGDIQKMVGGSLTTIVKYISSLDKKGVIEKHIRGLNQTNTYILSDREEMWKAGTLEELKLYARETDEERNIRIARQGGFSVEKDGRKVRGIPREKEPAASDPFGDVDPLRADGESVIVKDRDAGRERLYVKVYFDFLESGLLSLREIGMYIILKRHINVKYDLDGTSQTVYPSIKTLEQKTGKGHTSVIGLINSLVEKGVVEKVYRGFAQTNLYMISDRASMWTARNYEEVSERAKETEVEAAARLLQEAGYRVWKEPDEGSEKTQSRPPGRPRQIRDDSRAVSRERARSTERTQSAGKKKQTAVSDTASDYTREFLYEHSGMSRLIRQREESTRPFSIAEKDLIDICMNVILETLNSRRSTITVNGEPKSVAVVKSVFMKLDSDAILYAIAQFQSQTTHISRPTAYLRTILYNAGLGEHELSEVNDTQKALHENGYGIFTINSGYTGKG